MAVTNVVLFTPLAEKTAQENLSAFIEFCKTRLTVFGKNLPFDDFIWDVSDFVHIRAKNFRVRIFFSSWETVNDAKPKPMPDPFASFAKAYVRYQHGLKPVVDHSPIVAAMRAMCAALYESGKNSPLEVDGHILNRAAQLLEATNSAARAYRLGQKLQHISDFLIEKRFIKTGVRWKSHIKRNKDTKRVGKDFDDRRQEKLPSAADLDAVAEAYRCAKEPEDVMVTSIAAIMCSTPDRISEILTLRADCEHVDRLPDGREVYGLRYWPAKGADPMIKYVIPSMVDLVKDAISRIRQITESSRILARWYESHPKQLYLPAHLEYLRGQELTLEEVSEVLYGLPYLEQEAKSWLLHRKVRVQGARKADLRVQFSILENELISLLPDGFPISDKSSGLRFSESLCIAPIFFLQAKEK